MLDSKETMSSEQDDVAPVEFELTQFENKVDSVILSLHLFFII